jgi:small subunit ribosomal protein S6
MVAAPWGRYSRPPFEGRSLTPSREYELVLMLDPEITEERREQIAAEARKRIESGGSLKQDTAWGMRKLAYEIQQRTEADYRLFRFETDGGLLDDLSHNLRIADGVLRFRIFKVDPRSPAIVPPTPVGATATTDRSPRRPQPEPAADEAADESTEAEAEAEPPEPAPDEAQAPSPEPEEAAPAAEPAGEEPAAGQQDPEREGS